MTRSFCDRCGKEEPRHALRPDKLVTVYLDMDPSQGRKEADVCGECHDLLREVTRLWFEDGQKT